MNNLQLLKHLPPLTAIQAERCRRSFYYFVKTFWSTIIAEEPVWNWHIEYICSELQQIAERVKRREPSEYTYYIINVPPGSSKSTICSQMYIAWVWTIDPTQRFICGSYSQTIARKDATFTQSILTSDKYKALFPDINLIKEAVDNIKNTAHGERYATSVGSGITGIHAHQIIIDDPLNPKQASSNVERQTANNWIDQTLTTRKVDKKLTPTIVVMQRLHESDVTGHLLNKGASAKHICLPAEDTAPVVPNELRANYINGLLDIQRLDFGVLKEMRNNLGSYGYAGQMLQQPAPDEGGIIKKAWFGRFTLGELPADVIWNFPSDTAYTADQRNDPSGLLSYCYHNNNFYIRHWEEMYLEFPDLVRKVQEVAKAHGYSGRSQILIEPKVSGKSLVQTLRRETGLNVVEDVPPNKDKTARAQDIAPIIEGKRVYLLEGAAWVDNFLTQISQFPNASHDEVIDMLVIMISKHINGKRILAFG